MPTRTVVPASDWPASPAGATHSCLSVYRRFSGITLRLSSSLTVVEKRAYGRWVRRLLDRSGVLQLLDLMYCRDPDRAGLVDGHGTAVASHRVIDTARNGQGGLHGR